MKRKNRTLAFLCFTLLIFSLIACNASSSPLDKSESQWERQGIASYQIEVLVVNSIWHAQSYTITVKNGEVLDGDSRCVPAPMEMGSCEVTPFIAEEYTVPGLFAKAHSESEKPDTTHLNIEYDPTYGHPTHISFNDPEILDEDWSWQVTSFEVIP